MPTSSMMMKRMFGGLVLPWVVTATVWQRTRASIAAANRVVFMRAPPFGRANRRTLRARIAIGARANHKDWVRLRFDLAGHHMAPPSPALSAVVARGRARPMYCIPQQIVIRSLHADDHMQGVSRAGRAIDGDLAS